MIRVISGLYKGRKLKQVPSENVRPMPQKLKGSLFSIIHSQIPDADFLDGFAGTGSMGIEALSRGARLVVFIDEFYPAVKIIRHNLAKCQADDRALVFHKEFNRAVINMSRDEMKFDLIFLDPPYRLLDERNPLKVIYKRDLLKENGLIILRYHFKTKFEAKYFHLERRFRRGDDILAFYKFRNSGDTILNSVN